VIGSSVIRAPTASAMALAIAAAGGPMGGSPMPRAPNGPFPGPTSKMIAWMSGTSFDAGMR
jgi:hypothetical protein